MAEPYRNPFIVEPKPQPVVSAAVARDRMVENMVRTGRGLPPLSAAVTAPATRPMVSASAARDGMIRNLRNG